MKLKYDGVVIVGAFNCRTGPDAQNSYENVFGHFANSMESRENG